MQRLNTRVRRLEQRSRPPDTTGTCLALQRCREALAYYRQHPQPEDEAICIEDIIADMNAKVAEGIAARGR